MNDLPKSAEKSEIVLYQPDNTINVEVRLEKEDVWLNRQQIALLFDRDIKTIGKHINNALKEELSQFSVVAKFATTATHTATVAKFATLQNEGGRMVERQVEYYNLDMILSVGYRVKSSRGIQFRVWANRVLKDYILKGYAVNQRFENLESRVSETEKKIDFFVKTSLPPVQGIFFNGQIFDAYVFVNDIIKSAKKSIVLIDNYIDETVLKMFSEKAESVKVILLTKDIKEKLSLSVEKFNKQYKNMEAKKFDICHDRFLIIDNREIYHLGASLKDLGRKIFAFSKMETDGFALLEKIGDL